MEKKQMKWYHGLLAMALFAGVMVLEGFGFLGKNMWATFIGECLFVVVAVGVVLIAGVKPAEVFQFRRVKIIPLVGLYLMWRGLIAFGICLTEAALYFFPSLMDNPDGLTAALEDMPFLLALFLIAAVPAFCEEMLFRGTLLKSLGQIKAAWLIILLDGLIFAAAHFSLIKMIPVGIVGILLAYIVYTGSNLSYSMFVHFINNAWSVILTYALFSLGGGSGKNTVSEAAEGIAHASLPLAAIGVTLCGCTLSPLLIYIGHNLFRRDRQGSPLKKQWLLLAGSLCLLILSLGMLIFALGFEEAAALGGLTSL